MWELACLWAGQEAETGEEALLSFKPQGRPSFSSKAPHSKRASRRCCPESQLRGSRCFRESSTLSGHQLLIPHQGWSLSTESRQDYSAIHPLPASFMRCSQLLSNTQHWAVRCDFEVSLAWRSTPTHSLPPDHLHVETAKKLSPTPQGSWLRGIAVRGTRGVLSSPKSTGVVT